MNRRGRRDPLMTLTIPIIRAPAVPANPVVEVVDSDDDTIDDMPDIDNLPENQENVDETESSDSSSERSSPEMRMEEDTPAGAYGVDQPALSAANDGARLSAASANTSISDFRPSKQAKLLLQSPQKDGGVDESECCSICFEAWANSGIHRLVSLKCGHLFGQSCIEKWLAGQQTGKCPQCNAKAHRKDIRVLFARALKVIDTAERDRALLELEKEKEERRRVELEAAKMRLQYQMAISECNQMKREVERQRQQLDILQSASMSQGSQGSSTSQSQSFSACKSTFALEKNVKISEIGGCRVLAYSSTLAAVCVSQPTSTPLFSGFGIKKISTIDFKSAQYVPIHAKPIRDLSFNPKAVDSLLLSCSIDKSIKLTSLLSNKVVQTYECPAPVWSCAWNLDDGNYFYAGQQNGAVSVFDTRNLASFVQQLNLEGSRSPAVSLQYHPQSCASQFRPGGLLVGQLEQSAYFERRNGDDYHVHLLPLEANLTSLSLEESTGHVLTTYRPSPKHPNIRHQVCELAIQNDVQADGSMNVTVTCNGIQTFHSGPTQKLLARSRLVLLPDGNSNQLLVCAGDEASQSVHIWNASSGQLQQKMASVNPVIDISPVVVDGQSCLITLTEKDMSVYKWR